MKYSCLIFDHDDTAVNSTATIHHPCFVDYISTRYPDRTCSLEEYFLKNFSPGIIPFFRDEYGMSAEDMEEEYRFWQNYVSTRIPAAYPGIREIMERQKAEGGLVCVISHSMKANILRDYEANGLPEPDAVYGWDEPAEERKPAPFPVYRIMERFNLSPRDILVIDDLKPGYDMAKAAGVAFAAAGWANDIPEIENFMRASCELYFKTVGELADYLA